VPEFNANKALVGAMGKLKQRQLQVAKEEADREKAIKNACDGVQQGRFASIRKAAEAYGVHVVITLAWHHGACMIPQHKRLGPRTVSKQVSGTKSMINLKKPAAKPSVMHSCVMLRHAFPCHVMQLHLAMQLCNP